MHLDNLVVFTAVNDKRDWTMSDGIRYGLHGQRVV